VHDLLLRQRPGEALLQIGDAPVIRVLPAESLPDGAILLTLDGQRERIEAGAEGDALVLAMAAGSWRLRWRDPYLPAGGEVAIEGRLAAPIPGRVVQLLVAVGDRVARGQLLAVLEAMKTELRIAAPAAGVVTHIGCAAGDSVEEGTEIVTLGPPPK
jgi:3-methylcrotonyl-CoA carboxylase alpha subunit